MSKEHIAIFKALGEPNRLGILKWLASVKNPKNVGEICNCCDLDFSVISRHLRQLKDSGLLKAEKKGKEVFYSVNAKEVSKILRKFAEFLDGCC